MIVNSLGLEEDGIVNMSPEVGHGVATVSLTRHQFQTTPAVRAWTRFTLKKDCNVVAIDRENLTKIMTVQSESTMIYKIITRSSITILLVF